MGTDARYACPVCSEPYDAPPAECFRCETPLGSWWRFEDAVLRSGAGERSPSPRMLPVVGAAVLGALVAAVGLRMTTGGAPVAAVPATAVALPPAAPPRAAPTPASAPAAPAAVMTYRVQPGDSLWRISAALTGDGRNWRTLWPTMDPTRPLAVGTVLEAPIR